MDNVREAILDELAAMQEEWDLLVKADKRQRELAPLRNRLMNAYKAVTSGMPSDAADRSDLIERAIRVHMVKRNVDGTARDQTGRPGDDWACTKLIDVYPTRRGIRRTPGGI